MDLPSVVLVIILSALIVFVFCSSFPSNLGSVWCDGGGGGPASAMRSKSFTTVVAVTRRQPRARTWSRRSPQVCPWSRQPSRSAAPQVARWIFGSVRRWCYLYPAEMRPTNAAPLQRGGVTDCANGAPLQLQRGGGQCTDSGERTMALAGRYVHVRTDMRMRALTKGADATRHSENACCSGAQYALANRERRQAVVCIKIEQLLVYGR